MSQRTIARRYANALYEEAVDAGVVEDVDDDVSLLRTSLADMDELRRFFESPVIPSEKKVDVITSLLSDKVDELTVRFLRLLVAKDREDMVEAILDSYQDLRDEQKGIVDVYVRTAQPLSDENEKDLKAALKKKTGKNVRLHVEERPDLIGGMVIRMGDRVIDGSVRNQLATLHERLRNTNVVSANGQT